MQTAAQTELCTIKDVKKIAKHNLEGIKYTNIRTVQLSAPLSCLVYNLIIMLHKSTIDPFTAMYFDSMSSHSVL